MAKNNITSAQYITYMLSTIAALCLMNLPSLLFKNFGQNSLLAVIIISLVTLILLLAANSISCRCGYPNPHTVFTGLLGKYIGNIVSILLLVYLLVFTALSFKIFLFIVNTYYLPKTPIIVIALLLILPSLYTASGGIRVFGHTSTLLYLLIPVFLLLLLLARNNYLISNIFPLIDENVIDILPTIPFLFITSSAILGSFFIFPIIVDPRKIKKSILIFVLIALAFMLFIYCIARFYFGDTIAELILPFYNLSTIYKGRLLERLDVLFILVFIPVLGIFNSFFFTTLHKAQGDILPKLNKKHPIMVLGVLGIAEICLGVFPQPDNNIWQSYLWGNCINLAVILFLIIIYFAYFIKRRWLKQ